MKDLETFLKCYSIHICEECLYKFNGCVVQMEKDLYEYVIMLRKDNDNLRKDNDNLRKYIKELEQYK